ncbi:MAG: VWA domain-containing protein, partial [Chloroflexota bacterium]
ARSERYLLIDVVAPVVEPDPSRRRPPVNLAFVLDRSGSMGGQNKLGLAKQAVLEAVHRLDPLDRFAVVTYDNRIDVVVPGMPATIASRLQAAELLRHVEARGNTNLHGGWITGCEQVAAGLASEGVNRVLLLTDGLANNGITAPDELARQAFELRSRGVSTSTFGVGSDFDEALLQTMADNGGGHFYFIGDVAQMRDHITSEVGDTLEVVAREVVVELDLPESARVDTLSPFRLERAGTRVRISLGDMVSGQRISLALKVTFDYGEIGREIGAVASIADRDGAFGRAIAAVGVPERVAVAWAYADHDANDAQERDVEVTRFVARMTAESAKQQAVRMNREGRYAEASDVLFRQSLELSNFAGEDVMLNAMVGELGEEAVQYAAPMPARELKERHFRSSMLARQRTEDGKARKD